MPVERGLEMEELSAADITALLLSCLHNEVMDSPNRREEELHRREKELQEREHALRLRELEAELDQQAQRGEPPISPTTKHHKTNGALQQRFQQAITVAKFLGIVVAVVVAMRIAAWLATAVMVGAIAWVGYKLLFEKRDRAKR